MSNAAAMSQQLPSLPEPLPSGQTGRHPWTLRQMTILDLTGFPSATGVSTRYRDLEPENAFLTPDSSVKILDFASRSN